MLLFKTTSAKEIEISESVDGEIDKDTLLSLCKAAWQDPHDFYSLTIIPSPATRRASVAILTLS